MNIKIAIADRDTEYIARLVTGLEKYQDISLAVYSDEESLKKAFRERKYDVFLFDPGIYESPSDYLQARAELKLVLDDGEYMLPEGFGSAKKVAKYQRISRIYKKILEYYSEVCGRGGTQDVGETAVLVFYSPVGGAGKTTLALVSAAKFAAHGKRTFYISLEDIASEDFYLPQGEDRGLSELMLHMERNTNIAMKLQGMMKQKTQHFYYLNHFSSPNDIYEMPQDELQDLLRALQTSGLFDVIVVDTGTDLREKNRLLFEKADRIVVVEREDAISERKANAFFAQQDIINEYGDKMVRVINFAHGSDSEIGTKIPIAGKIGVLSDTEPGRVVDILAGSSKTQFLTDVGKG